MAILAKVLSGAAIGFVSAPLFDNRSTTAGCEPYSLRNFLGLGGSHFSSATAAAVDEKSVYLGDGSFAYSSSTDKLPCDKTWGVPWNEAWDRPEKRWFCVGPNSEHKRQIILIRHGQYQNERAGDDKIRTLTPLGERQARETGQYLSAAFTQASQQADARDARRAARANLKCMDNSDESDDLKTQIEQEYRESVVRAVSEGGFMLDAEPSHIYVSDMTRAKQTAQCILEAFPAKIRRRLTIDAELRERFPCDPQPKYSRHRASVDDMKIAEVVFERYFHRPLRERTTVDVVVCHANVIRYLTLRALQLPPEAWLRTSLPHCSITNIIIDGRGRTKVLGYGSFGHLPPSMTTTSNVP